VGELGAVGRGRCHQPQGRALEWPAARGPRPTAAGRQRERSELVASLSILSCKNNILARGQIAIHFENCRVRSDQVRARGSEPTSGCCA
jgi:hypothetical protein